METTAAQGSQRNPPGSNNITTTIESRSQQTLPAVRTCKSITRGKHGIAALSQKGNLSKIEIAFKLSSHKVQSVWQRLQILRLPICLRVHDCINFQSWNQTAILQATPVIPNLPVSKPTVQVQTQAKHDCNPQTFVSFHVSSNSFHYLHSSGSFQWLSTCCKLFKLQFHTNPWLLWCIGKLKTTIPKQTVSTYSFTVHC